MTKKLNETFKVSQTAVQTSATKIVSGAAGRDTVTIQPTGSVTVYIGGPGVTISTGFPVGVGLAVTMETTSDIYAVAESVTAVAVLAEG